MYINGLPITGFGATLLADPEIGSTEIDVDFYCGNNRTTPTRMADTFGMKPIRLQIEFRAENIFQLRMNKSKLDWTLLQKGCDLFLPDGFYYAVIPKEFGELVIVIDQEDQALAHASYELVGFQHLPLVTVSGGSVHCASTVPQTDCLLQVAVSASAATYTITLGDNSYVFTDRLAGDVLIVDGMTKRVLINGAPGSLYCSWIKLPFLVPGENTISAPDTVTTKYYPTLM